MASLLHCGSSNFVVVYCESGKHKTRVALNKIALSRQEFIPLRVKVIVRSSIMESSGVVQNMTLTTTFEKENASRQMPLLVFVLWFMLFHSEPRYISFFIG